MQTPLRLQHRWSGWPGAFCLDCGSGDPFEEALAAGDLDYYCTVCRASWPQGPCPMGGEHVIAQVISGEHSIIACPFPGAGLFDPERQVEVTIEQQDG